MTESAKILVFDEEKDTQDLFCQIFRHQIDENIYSFSFAFTFDEVHKQLDSNSFDMFITDLHIAGGDIVSLISQLREKCPYLRTIVTSAYGDIGTLRTVMRSGSHDFVIKPLDAKDLMQTVANTFKVVQELKRAKRTEQKLTAISDELSLSAQLQKSILPGKSLRESDLELWADTLPAAEVGGDFYDFFKLDDDRIGVVMADVSGKNVTAAMFAIIAKTLIKTFSKVYKSPAECFYNVNHSLCEENVTTRFVTAMYGTFNLKTLEFVYTNAGHLPIVSARPNEEPKLLDCDTGIALGIMDGMDFVDNVHKLVPGELIMLYTDGVNEATDIHEEEFEFDRFLKVFKEHPVTTPKLITNAVIAAIKEFTAGAPQSDDITTLCLKYRPRIVQNVN